MTSCLPARREEVVAPPPDPPPTTTLAQGFTTLSQGPTCASGLCLRSAPGTASAYKMRLRADPYRSQITQSPHTESQREESGESQFQGSSWRATLSREAWMPIWGLSTESMSPGRLPVVVRLSNRAWDGERDGAAGHGCSRGSRHAPTLHEPKGCARHALDSLTGLEPEPRLLLVRRRGQSITPCCSSSRPAAPPSRCSSPAPVAALASSSSSSSRRARNRPSSTSLWPTRGCPGPVLDRHGLLQCLPRCRAL